MWVISCSTTLLHMFGRMTSPYWLEFPRNNYKTIISAIKIIYLRQYLLLSIIFNPFASTNRLDIEITCQEDSRAAGYQI